MGNYVRMFLEGSLPRYYEGNQATGFHQGGFFPVCQPEFPQEPRELIEGICFDSYVPCCAPCVADANNQVVLAVQEGNVSDAVFYASCGRIGVCFGTGLDLLSLSITPLLCCGGAVAATCCCAMGCISQLSADYNLRNSLASSNRQSRLARDDAAECFETGNEVAKRTCAYGLMIPLAATKSACCFSCALISPEITGDSLGQHACARRINAIATGYPVQCRASAVVELPDVITGMQR